MNHMTIDNIDAPWNTPEKEDREVQVTVSITISKSLTLTTNNYEIINSGKDEDGNYYVEVEYNDLKCDVKDRFVLPNNLSKYTKVVFNEDLDLRAAGMPKYLIDALEDCDDWVVDEFEVIEE